MAVFNQPEIILSYATKKSAHMNAVYFSITGTASSRYSCPATFSPGTNQIEIWKLLESISDVSQWRVPDLTCTGTLGHFPPTDVVGRLCSPELRHIIDSFTSDALWLPATIHHNGAAKEYFFLHFTTIPDVIDPAKSQFVNGKLFRPYLSRDRVESYKVFILSKTTNLIYVHKDVRATIQRASIKGLSFERVDVG